MIRKILAVAVVVFACTHSAYSTTTLTGTIKSPGQSRFTGVVVLTPSRGGMDTVDNRVVLPIPTVIMVTNGQLVNPPTMSGNDVIQPSGTWYIAQFKDMAGRLVYQANYVITGATFDLGSAVPTSIITNNLAFQDLIGIRTLSVTGAATFGAGMTITGGSIVLNSVSTQSITGGTLSIGLGRSGGVNGFPDVYSTSGASKLLLAGNVTGGGSVGIQGGIFPSTGQQHKRTASCTTAAVANASCNTTVTWGVAFADTSYTASCGFVASSGIAMVTEYSTKTTSTMIAVLENTPGSAAASSGTIDCIAMHD